ncbi:MAG: acyltransferase family protein [Gammaproteobacteria bacterium]
MNFSLASPEFQLSERNHGIDTLRGISIFLVIANHIGIRIPLAKTAVGSVLPLWLTNALNWRGYEAVFIFFVISGFLITGLSLRRWGGLNRIGVGGFYGRRFARIVPLLLTLVLVLSVLHLAGVSDYVIHHANQSLPGAIWAALGLHLNWYEGHTNWLPGGWDVLWSLSIEETFYLAFPIIALLTRRVWVLLPLLIVLALSLPFSRDALAGHPIWQEKAYLPAMAAIATGMIGALAAARFTPPRRVFSRALCVSSAVCLVWMLIAEKYLWPVLGNGIFLLLTFSVMCLLIGLQWSRAVGPRRPWPGLGWLRSMGRHSYEIYLTHMFVVFGGIALFRSVHAGMRWAWLWYLPILLLCWLLGVIVARYFSVPCDRALRKFLLRHERLPTTLDTVPASAEPSAH